MKSQNNENGVKIFYHEAKQKQIQSQYVFADLEKSHIFAVMMERKNNVHINPLR